MEKDRVKVYFSFDEETKRLIEKLGYVPKDCYCTTEPDIFIPEHGQKNSDIVKREIERVRTKQRSYREH